MQSYIHLKCSDDAITQLAIPGNSIISKPNLFKSAISTFPHWELALCQD